VPVLVVPAVLVPEAPPDEAVCVVPPVAAAPPVLAAPPEPVFVLSPVFPPLPMTAPPPVEVPDVPPVAVAVVPPRAAPPPSLVLFAFPHARTTRASAQTGIRFMSDLLSPLRQVEKLPQRRAVGPLDHMSTRCVD
jgi:hypothetical protein